MTSVRRHLIFPLVLAVFLLPGCDLGTDALPQVLAELVIVSGDAQAGRPGATLPNPLVVQVNDTEGRPVDGVRIAWQVIVGNGSVSSSVTTTNDAGQAAVFFTLGSVEGPNGVDASVFEVGAEDLLVTFGANGVP